MASRRQILFLSLTLGCGVSGRAQTAELEVNTASQPQLEALPGVGPALAERLLKARQTRIFADWTDLCSRVKGIGSATARKPSQAGLRVQGQPYMSDTTQSR